MQANTVPQARRMRLEFPATPQTTILSYPFSVTHKLHRLKQGEVKNKVKDNGNIKSNCNVKTFSIDCRNFSKSSCRSLFLNWLFSACDTANCAGQKWEKERQMSERSEFLTLPIFVLHNWVPEGQWRLRRLLLLTFLGEARKVSGRRATPGQRS